MIERTFENWEIAVAKKRVNDARDNWQILKAEGFDDLVQECLLHWIQERKKYDPNRGASVKTFMAWVVKGHLTTIKDKLLADMRRPFFEAVSLYETFDDDSGSASENYKHEPQTECDPSIEIDVSIALRKLTPQQKQICRLIQEENLSFNQIEKRIKKHHRVIRKEVERIRNIFQKKGLRDYLQ